MAIQDLGLRATSHVRLRARVHAFLHGIKWTVFHGHLDYFQEPPLGGRPDIKTGRPWHSECSQSLVYFILFLLWIEIAFGWGPGHIWLHTTLEGPWPQYMISEVSGQPLHTFFWALPITWSRLLARVWSGPRDTMWMWYSKKENKLDDDITILWLENDMYNYEVGSMKPT